MIEEKSVLIEFLGDNPLIRMIDFLIERKPFDCTKEEIIRETGISRASLFKYWNKLEEYGIVKKTRQVGRAELYVINEENPIVQKFLIMESELIKKAMEIATRKPVPVKV